MHFQTYRNLKHQTKKAAGAERKNGRLKTENGVGNSLKTDSADDQILAVLGHQRPHVLLTAVDGCEAMYSNDGGCSL